MFQNKNQFHYFLIKYLTQRNSLTNWRNLRPFSQISDTSQESQEIKKCCDIFKIPYDFDEKQLRNAYIEGCKRSHPDLNPNQKSQSNEVNEEFSSIESSYNTLKLYLKRREDNKQMVDSINESIEEEEEKRLKQKVLQHRHYLNFDGIGYGTPNERQKQYQKHRLSKATNRVNEFQLNQIKSSDQLSQKKEIALKDVHLHRQIKTKQGFDRLVEDLIQESMARGDFQHLEGYGKPLKYKPEYPYLDSTTYKLNEILINNGFVPEWVLLEKEIREERNSIKSKLFCLKKESKLANILFVKQLLAEKVTEVNKMIDKYNRIVPILSKQQTLIILEKEVNKIMKSDENNTGAIDGGTNGANTVKLVDMSDNQNNNLNNISENLSFNSNNSVFKTEIDNSLDESVKRVKRVKNEKNLFKKIFSLFS